VTDVDTRGKGHRFRLDLYTGVSSTPYGAAPPASTVYLTVEPSDELNRLRWQEDTPWDNFAYEVWRSTAGGAFEQIASTADLEYLDDEALINGVEYCYRITALGDYGLQNIPSPLINESQVACGTPVDNIGPCAPLLSVTNGCEGTGEPPPGDVLSNVITWQPACGPEDIDFYILYYASQPGAAWVEIGRPDAGETTFTHAPGETIAGCYTIVAVDALGNQSAYAEPKCVENCPLYELPNAFTPNGDGRNDIFRPISARFIDQVDFKVFNRWGQVIFSTTDPMIQWDGRNTGGKDVSDGVYYYTCDVFEPSGSFPTTLTGFIQLIRGQ
jgi:gliding motility-associated-like protein